MDNFLQNQTWLRPFVPFFLVLIISTVTHQPAQAQSFSQTHVKYGSEPRQTMDIYTPIDGGQQSRPVIIYVHGGGWMHGDKSNVAEKPDFFTNKGYAFISVNYQLSPRVTYKEMAKDISRAIYWIYHHAHHYQINMAKINLMGHSAGGHLVALIGTDSYYLASAGLPLQVINSIVNLDGPVDLTEFIPRNNAYMEVFGDNKENWAHASPVTYVSNKNLPPILLVGKDKKSFTAYAEKARLAGNAVDLFFNHALTHREITNMLGSKNGPAEAVEMTNAVAGFLARNNASS
ncbi:alpha/beta hydrolase [Neobacillus muris]|uniref:alpha/beta hydrolase n=1 Tax=Neobacillus muris TaxID=2941334 RepID=UPI00203C6B55|nr:alpha/beta hydrolase [Neobacillus muris]